MFDLVRGRVRNFNVSRGENSNFSMKASSLLQKVLAEALAQDWLSTAPVHPPSTPSALNTSEIIIFSRNPGGLENEGFCPGGRCYLVHPNHGELDAEVEGVKG